MPNHCKPNRYFEIREELKRIYDVDPDDTLNHGSFSDGSSLPEISPSMGKTYRQLISTIASQAELHLTNQMYYEYKISMRWLAGEILLYEFLRERARKPDKSQRIYLENLRRMQFKPVGCGMAISYNMRNHDASLTPPQNQPSSSISLFPMEEQVHAL